MRDLDDTDRHILRLLLDDARRPFSDIAEHVDLSAPAVSDRVDRLRELGVIRGFTVDVDRSRLQDGIHVLVDLDVEPGSSGTIRSSLVGASGVEHVFETAEGDVFAQLTIEHGDVLDFLAERVDLARVRDVSVRLLRASEWTPGVGEATLALSCAECDNTVTTEGESSRFGGTLYHFCCPSCLASFEERYERMERGA